MHTYICRVKLGKLSIQMLFIDIKPSCSKYSDYFISGNSIIYGHATILAVTEETHDNLSQKNRSPGRVSSLGLPYRNEY
jgi:hypothetical protein